MDDTQTNSFSQATMSKLVDDSMKDFDISKLHEIGYDKIQELADQYIASVNPEIQAIGKSLKDIDPKIFELTPSEEKIKKIHDELIKKGKSKAQADAFGIQLLETAIQNVTQTIVGAMNEKSFDEWTNLQAHNPNIFQQMYLLDESAKLLLGKTYDQLYEESLERAISLTLQIITEKEKSLPLVADLTEEQIQTVMSAFNANQYEIAIQLIYNFASENGNSTK